MSTQERRKFPRTRLDLPLDLNLGDKAIPSRIYDISTSGIRFRTPASLPLMSRVQLAIELGLGSDSPLALSGVVVRSAEFPDDSGNPEPAGGKFETAIFFDDLTDQEHRALAQFLSSRQI